MPRRPPRCGGVQRSAACAFCSPKKRHRYCTSSQGASFLSSCSYPHNIDLGGPMAHSQSTTSTSRWRSSAAGRKAAPPVPRASRRSSYDLARRLPAFFRKKGGAGRGGGAGGGVEVETPTKTERTDRRSSPPGASGGRRTRRGRPHERGGTGDGGVRGRRTRASPSRAGAPRAAPVSGGGFLRRRRRALLPPRSSGCYKDNSS